MPNQQPTSMSNAYQMASQSQGPYQGQLGMVVQQPGAMPPGGQQANQMMGRNPMPPPSNAYRRSPSQGKVIPHQKSVNGIPP